LVKRRAAKFRLVAQQAQRLGEHRDVRLRRGWRGRRERSDKDHGEQQHQERGDEVRGPPAGRLAEDAGEGTGEQDAADRPAEQSAGHHPAPVLGDQPCGHRRDHLRGHRRRADQGACGHQDGQAGRGTGREQAQAAEGEQCDDECAVRDPVGEWDQQEDAGGVAELSCRHDQCGGGGRHVEPVGDQRADGLREVDRPDRYPAGHGEEQNRPASQSGRVAGRRVVHGQTGPPAT